MIWLLSSLLSDTEH